MSITCATRLTSVNHIWVLMGGALPLSLLEDKIDAWIESK